MISSTSDRRRAAALVGVGAVLLILLLSGPLPASGRSSPLGSSATATAAHPSHTVGGRSFVHPPALGSGGSNGGPHPAYGSVYYTQIGATIAGFNNSVSQKGVKSLSEDIPLVSSPYPIGYELNGLTNKGDWFQIVVGVNWAGCYGLDMITEVWNNAQGSGPVGCSSPFSMSFGDVIRLGLNFSSGIGICMDLADVTRGQAASDCQAEPDSGATEFVTLPGTSDGNGYFTGPMTEIANTTATSCPDYTHMPLVNYEFKSAFGVSNYLPWSDEFVLYGGACYSQAGSGVGFAAGDPATNYQDTASGYGYGPHYVAGQLYSMVNPSYGVRIQTDPIPLTSVSLAASATTIPTAANITLNATVSGGVRPYTAIYALNGTVFTSGPLSLVWTGSAPGSYRFQAYGVDKNLDVNGPSAAVTVLVNGPLGVSAIRASLPTGNADAGQTIVFSATASGGVPAYTYTWTGLPTECPAVDAASVTCTPAGPGFYTIGLSVTDSNATTVDAATRPFQVSSAPALELQASVTRLDTGQPIGFIATVAGGAGNLSYGWSGLPDGCAAADAPALNCFGGTPALYTVSVSVTDANGLTVTSAGLAVQVYGEPTVVLSVDRMVTDAGIATTFTVTPTGGAGGFSVAWTGLPIGCAGANVLILVCAPTYGGTYAVSVNVTDAVDEIAASTDVTVFAYDRLNLTVAGPETVAVGNLLTASAEVSGGAPGVTYSWSGLPEGCTAPASAQLSCQPSLGGDYNITVTVVDSGGGSSTVLYHLSVVYPPAPPSSATMQLPLLLLLGLVVVVVAAIVAVAAMRRRGSA